MAKPLTSKIARLTDAIVSPIARNRQSEPQSLEAATQEVQRRLKRLTKESKLREERILQQLQQQLDALVPETRRQEQQNASLWEKLQRRLDQLIDEIRQTNKQREGDVSQKIDVLLKATEWGENEPTRTAKQWRKEVRTFHELLYKINFKKDGFGLDLAELPQVCLEHITPVRSPLVLISQIQRSGGTLLNELLDGHPECHAHPYELYIGHPEKHSWPVLDLHDRPEQWFTTLFETPTIRSFREGYQKYGSGADERPELFRFLFLPSLQREIFLKCVAGTHVTSQRAVFDAYMTSYFNAWLNNQNLSGEKKAIVAFVPRLAIEEIYVERFFSVYPDGKLLSSRKCHDPRPHSGFI
jgi:hypothetical protein